MPAPSLPASRFAAWWRVGVPGPARRRALAFVLLAGVVVCLHAVFLDGPASALGRPWRQPGEAVPMRMVLAGQPRVVPPPVPAHAADPVPRPKPAPVPAVSTTPAPTLAPISAPIAAPAPAGVVATPAPEPPPMRPSVDPSSPAPPATEPVPDAPPAVPGLGSVPPWSASSPDAPARAVAGTPPADARFASAADPAARSASSSAPADTATGTPPPVYPTVLPDSFTLDYRVVRGAATGSGQLRWEATPEGYTLGLQADAKKGTAIDWLSRGAFDAAGLAPSRMVERQKQREVRAVNFQRDKGLISFSGSTRVGPLLAGAQDRLSWLVQLVSVVQARRNELEEGDTLRFQVATPRGDVDEWIFVVGAAAPVELAGRRWGALKLVREPARPYDQRVEVWLALAAGSLPLGVTMTTVPGDEPLELWLSGGLKQQY